jgi:NAD(P)-dependent dehydrogenase (short-subunit alcohol dehydrogenase family)
VRILKLNEKIIVVTGGAGLLGSRFCTAIAEQGGLAIIADLDLEVADRVAADIKATGGKAKAATLDITSSVEVEQLIASLHDRYGRIDAVVNNAYPRNSNYGRKLEEVAYADFCANISSHLGGYFLVAQKFAIYFQKAGSGNIINMGSIYGCIAPRFKIYEDTHMTSPVEYAAIKAAIAQLTRYFAQYYKKDGIRVNNISPGGIFDQQPEIFVRRYNAYAGTKGMLDGDDVVGTLLFLLSDASKYVTGQEILVDDGFSL